LATGSNTPRTGSYAGAVKTAPTDFHLEFTYGGKAISLDDTIYGAVHKNQPAGGTSTLGSYGSAVVFKFRKVEGPASTQTGGLDAPSPGSVLSTLPAAFDPATPTAKILRLLRVLYNLSVDSVESKVDANLFVNNKLTAKLTRQMEEIMIIAR
jgi:E3 ubiquitin-protein ligase TRIP12